MVCLPPGLFACFQIASRCFYLSSTSLAPFRMSQVLFTLTRSFFLGFSFHGLINSPSPNSPSRRKSGSNAEASRALTAPGYLPDWHIGVRVQKTKKLVAFISGIKVEIRVRTKWVDSRSVLLLFPQVFTFPQRR